MPQFAVKIGEKKSRQMFFFGPFDEEEVADAWGFMVCDVLNSQQRLDRLYESGVVSPQYCESNGHTLILPEESGDALFDLSCCAA